MTISSDIKTAIEKNMELMINQTRAYLPFLKVAFPAVRDISELTFNMMVGNALTVFISQFAMRMQSPSEGDFAEFGKIVEPYRSKVKEMF
ncbi:MAG TPA: hypothetical protein VFV16_08050 [Candidatus Nitrosotalea sp.]|nr:hypothetical protein [Candidatus Nitrosotalea sp.]HEU5488759.1 hypothetical protein [Candidatus Nitrosotalea sp.]